MARRKKKQNKKETWQIGAVVLIVVVTSLFLVFTPAPEEVNLRSEDGLVVFEGVARPAAGVELIMHDDVAVSEPASLPLYEVVVPDGVVIEDGELTFLIKDASVDLTEVALYRFDTETFEWQALPTVFDLGLGTVSTSLTVSGSALVSFGVSEGE